MNQSFFSNGKLLLTAEYFVTQGALALAIPTSFGQTLFVQEKPFTESELWWKSKLHDDKVWYSGTWNLPEITNMGLNDSITKKLSHILLEAKKMNPNFLNDNQRFEVETKLDFNRNWGLGSSSTLINNVAQWAKVNAFELQFKCFGGSGYDVACAQNENPIWYQLKDKEPWFEQVDYKPPFANEMYFVYLNKKQKTEDSLKKMDGLKIDMNAIATMNDLTKSFTFQYNLTDFEKLIVEHEKLVSKTLGLTMVKSIYFNDFWGEVKSLGAWGGDFVLATSSRDSTATRKYFADLGFDTIIEFNQMIKGEN